MIRSWSNSKDNADEIYRLSNILEPRIQRLPDSKFIIMKIKPTWNDIDVYRWLVENTTDKIYITNQRIGFLNEYEAFLFGLRFL